MAEKSQCVTVMVTFDYQPDISKITGERGCSVRDCLVFRSNWSVGMSHCICPLRCQGPASKWAGP